LGALEADANEFSEDKSRVISLIEDYPHDTPLASRLVLGFVGRRPIHVVLAIDSAAAVCIVVTVYEPQPDQWETDFRQRRAK
jgi:hypothetical protein